MSVPEVGTALAGYRLVSRIGKGNNGTVFRAWNDKLARYEALKVISLNDDTVAADTLRDRFYGEIRSVNRVRSISLATIFAAGEEADFFWYSMELIDGVDLGSELSSAPPIIYKTSESLKILSDVAKVLDHLASQETPIFHGDVKPSNIVVHRHDGKFQYAVLVDFGVAVRRDAAEPDGTSGVQRSGVRGSRPYVPPEVLTERGLVAQSDQFSLACVAHELLAGGQAFPQRQLDTRGTQAGLLLPTTGQGVLVDRVFHRAWSQNPEDRWRSNTEFVEALAAATRISLPISRFRQVPGWFFAGAVLGGSIVGLAASWAERSGHITGTD